MDKLEVRKPLLLLLTVSLLQACGLPGDDPFVQHETSPRGRFIYDARPPFELALLAGTIGHQILLGDPGDHLRALPCYRARSLDPATFTLTLPDDEVVSDAGICRPFGLADGFFGRAARAGATTVEIRDGAQAIDQIPISVRDAGDVDVRFAVVVGQQPTHTLTLPLGPPQPFDLDFAGRDGAPIETGTSPITMHLADANVALFTNGTTDLVVTGESELRPIAAGTTTLTVTVAAVSRALTIVIEASR